MSGRRRGAAPRAGAAGARRSGCGPLCGRRARPRPATRARQRDRRARSDCGYGSFQYAKVLTHKLHTRCFDLTTSERTRAAMMSALSQIHNRYPPSRLTTPAWAILDCTPKRFTPDHQNSLSCEGSTARRRVRVRARSSTEGGSQPASPNARGRERAGRCAIVGRGAAGRRGARQLAQRRDAACERRCTPPSPPPPPPKPNGRNKPCAPERT